MSLTPKRRLTEKKMRANRANGRRSHGPATPAGRTRSAASNLRHGYFSKSHKAALTALGEDPAEYLHRLESLLDTWDPANALEMGLVGRLARALWEMERFGRIKESVAVKHLERSMEGQGQVQAILLYPLAQKRERLKKLWDATCMEWEANIGPQEMQLFEETRADWPGEKSERFGQLLLRLRNAGPAETPEVGLPAEAGQFPAIPHEELHDIHREMGGLLAREIEGIEKLILHDDDTDDARAQFDRDNILARGQEKAEPTSRAEELCLRQVWRTTNLLLKIKKAAATQRDVKSDDRSQ